MCHRVGGRGGDVEVVRKSTICRSGRWSWRGWPRATDRGQVRRTPSIGKGMAACHLLVERGSDAATAGGIGADEGAGGGRAETSFQSSYIMTKA